MVDEAPCCAHLRVIWTTDTDHHGLTHGWWECSDCETQFVPLARAVRAERDTERLDALERFAGENVKAGDHDDIVSLERYDDGEPPDREWRVMGRRTSYGYECGQGETLREAIDRASAPRPATP